MSIRVRQPLQSMTISGMKPLPDGLSQLIGEDVNVKEVIYKTPDGDVRYKVKHQYYDKRG